MNTSELFEINVSLKKEEKSADAIPLPISIVNRTSIGFTKAEVSVQDTESGQSATANFGYIASKTTSRETVHLPGGIDLCVFRITPQVGEDIVGGGAGNNAPGVNITVDE